MPAWATGTELPGGLYRFVDRPAGQARLAINGRPADVRIDRGFVWLSEDDFVGHFAADVDATRARVMFAVQQPLSATTFDDVMAVPAWKSLPGCMGTTPSPRGSRSAPR